MDATRRLFLVLVALGFIAGLLSVAVLRPIDRPDIHCVVVGDGPSAQQELDDLAKRFDLDPATCRIDPSSETD